MVSIKFVSVLSTLTVISWTSYLVSGYIEDKGYHPVCYGNCMSTLVGQKDFEEGSKPICAKSCAHNDKVTDETKCYNECFLRENCSNVKDRKQKAECLVDCDHACKGHTEKHMMSFSG